MSQTAAQVAGSGLSGLTLSVIVMSESESDDLKILVRLLNAPPYAGILATLFKR